MIENFKAFESLGADKKISSSDPIYIHEPQGKLRRSAAVKVWDKVGVGKSTISERGMFCVDYIKRDEVFEIAPIIVVPAELVKANILIDYAFKINENEYAIAFGYASLYNHRNQPNAEWKIEPLKGVIQFTAMRDIQPGEEIFISYGKTYWNTRDVSARTSPVSNTKENKKQK